MAMPEGMRVLALVGDAALAELVGRALVHPGFTAAVVHGERQIVPALTGTRFDLVLVGGRFDRRGPIILCEVVRERQPGVPVLVLHGDETDAARLKNHRARKLAAVDYLDVQGEVAPQERGQAIRTRVLESLGVAEDPASASWWERDPNAPVAAAVEAPHAEVASAVVDNGASASAAAEAEADLEPPTVEPVTEEDLEFARRLSRQVRSVDFVAPPPKTAPPEGVDRSVHKLRETVKELEWQLARLAHVYAGRVDEFDQNEALLRRAADRVRELEAEVEGARRVVAAEEASHAAALQGAARDAAVLREERDRALADAKEQAALATTTEKLGHEELTRQAAELGRRHAAEVAAMNAQFARTQASWEERVAGIKESILKLRADGDRQTELAAGREAEVGALREQLAALRASLEARTQEVERLSAEDNDAARLKVAGIEEQLRALQVQQQDALAVLQHQAAAGNATELLARLSAIEEHGGVVGSRLEGLGRELQTLADVAERNDPSRVQAQIRELGLKQDQTLEKVAEDVGKLLSEQSQAAGALEAVRAANPASVLDARLSVLEELNRLTADKIGDLSRLLSTVDEKVSTQGAATLQRLEMVVAGTKPRRLTQPVLAALPAAGARDFGGMAPSDVQGGVVIDVRSRRTLFVSVAAAAVVAAGVAVVWFGRDAEAPGAEAAAEDQRAATDAEGVAVAVEAAPAPAGGAAPQGSSAGPSAAAPQTKVALEDQERKQLRRKMFDAIKNKEWGEAADTGLGMQRIYTLDWEAALALAESLQKARRQDEAIGAYRTFLEQFPDNKAADDARYQLAGLFVTKKRYAEARRELEVVANGALSKKLKAYAAQALKELGSKGL